MDRSKTIRLDRRARRSVPAMIVVTALAAAGETRAAERQHGPHEHGTGRLNLAVEGHAVEIELAAPGADIVGFEHVATTEADRKALDDAVRRLKAPTLFRFSDAAKCRLEEVDVESAEMEEHGREKGHEKEHEGHEKEQEREHKNEARPDHGEDTHAEFRAHYHFRCERPDRLDHVDVGYFRAFPNARELEARTITAKGQGAQELTPQSTRLKF